jgi:hypothetical protein
MYPHKAKVLYLLSGTLDSADMERSRCVGPNKICNMVTSIASAQNVVVFKFKNKTGYVQDVSFY